MPDPDAVNLVLRLPLQSLICIRNYYAVIVIDGITKHRCLSISYNFARNYMCN